MKIFKPKYKAAPAPDRTPRPNPIVDAPATVADCASDYDAGGDVRATAAKQDARRRH